VVEAVLTTLRSSLPDIIPRSHKNLCSLLNSVRGLYIRQPTETKRGRPPRYTREQLLQVDSVLRDLLSRETRISVRSLEEVTNEDLSEIMPAVDQITLTLQKIARRKEREAARRLTI
jgi:hypothetical protein